MTRNRNYISQRVYELMISCGIKSYPVNMKSLISHPYFEDNNIAFETYENLERYKKNASEVFGSKDGALIKIPQADFSIVFYKAAQAKGRVNWTIAHEIGHAVLFHEEWNRDSEKDAHTFARLLLSHPLVLIAKNIVSPEAVSRLCGITVCAAKYRIKDIAGDKDVYNEWDYKIRNLIVK